MTDAVDRVYCVDTSSMLDAWRRHYPSDIFVGFWDDLQTLINQGKVIAPEQVLDELGKKDDEVAEWARQQRDLFVPYDRDLEEHVIHIMGTYPLMVKNTKGKHAADPFVIALARSRGCFLVSEEQHGSIDKPKIPDVCQAEKIRCIRLLDLIRHERWRY